MSYAVRLLKFAAKVALDKLIGSARTDELVREFLTRNPEELKRELADARREPTELASVEKAIDDAAAEAGIPLDQEQRDAAAMSVVTGFADLPDQAGSGDLTSTIAALTSDFGKEKKFLVWLTHPVLVDAGPGHYCHFYWKAGESIRVRDYISGRIYRPPGQSVRVSEWEEDWRETDLDLPPARVWEAGRMPIQCRKELGTVLAVDKGRDWRRMLRLMTEVANQWRSVN